MKKSVKIILICLAVAVLAAVIVLVAVRGNGRAVAVSKLDEPVAGTWQSEVVFPDWKGYVDDTLAMNSMYSFDGFRDQGTIYLTVGEGVKSFDLFVNNSKVNTQDMTDGVFELDISRVTVNGANTVQICNIQPADLTEAITLNVPYRD